MSKIDKKVMPAMKLSGLESFNITTAVGFVNIGERTNVTGSKAFSRMILNNQFDEALAVARQQVDIRRERSHFAQARRRWKE